MTQISNGVPATSIEGVTWRKSGRSAPGGNCVELATLDDGGVAMRNSRHPEGPALIYPREDLAAFLGGVKEGEFDSLLS